MKRQVGIWLYVSLIYVSLACLADFVALDFVHLLNRIQGASLYDTLTLVQYS